MRETKRVEIIRLKLESDGFLFFLSVSFPRSALRRTDVFRTSLSPALNMRRVVADGEKWREGFLGILGLNRLSSRVPKYFDESHKKDHGGWLLPMA